ncbi:unnamed protein product [Allacma fusca]|uniref:DNA-directed RNA polymerase subunit n=1 Tax=Allacma fusca TaxID=39272 RepID=A0A8J2J374_9HEXA|nr:unnamed protein product [Allacma fusca]
MKSMKRLKECAVPTGITFELYSADEIRKMSVVQVITPLSMSVTGQGLPGGLYDPLMGPHNSQIMCGTCQKNWEHCSGHFGHIELPLPVINPLFNKTVLQIFRLSCINCNSIIVPGALKYLTIAQLKLLEYGLTNEAQEAEYVLAEIAGETEAANYRKKSTHKGRVKKPNEISRTAYALKEQVIKRILHQAKMHYKCQFCGTTCRRMTQAESKILYSLSKEKRKSKRNDPVTDMSQVDDNSPVQKYLTPMEAKKHLQTVWIKETDFLQYVFPVLQSAAAEFPTNVFFIDVLPVTPPKNRPSQTVNNISVEHPLNLALRSVVSSCAVIQYIVRAIKNGMASLSSESQLALKGVNGQTLDDKLENTWNQLQADVDHVMDKDRNKVGGSSQAVAEMMGLKQMIERKEGLFRMHMMGKRVNYAARTVITPDPNISIDEIGIPDAFAKVLTYPCKVTPSNVYHMRQLVLNGPSVHPGAIAVRDENGVLARLSSFDQAQREAVANRLLVSDSLKDSSFTGVKTVYRHLQNGDLLLMNRQPSLHRPSIMAHRARVLRGEKVFRLHYANCKHYNADFDGDEMNAHFPQDEESRAEAASLVNACNHFLVPKDGTPLGGLIQDHVVGAVKMTMRGRFFTEQDYHQLVFFALSSHPQKVELEPPAMLKPCVLWSGKQVVSTIIKNLVPKTKVPLTFTSSAKIKSEEWRQWESRPCKTGGPILKDDLSESVVTFRHGELLTGVLDKVHLGATPFGLCHAFFELYGSLAVGSLLSAFSKLGTSFLQWEGFTLGVKDVLVMSAADDVRSHYMMKASAVGPEAAAKSVGLPVDVDIETIESNIEAVHRSRDPKSRAIVDQSYKQVLDKFTNKINSSCLPYGLVSIFPHNNLQLLVQSGAKGSTVNTMQMSCLLGQIELEGKRPALTLAGKSLPSFKPYDLSPRAGGFILGRFLTGIRPQEFFFHCMAGREGLIDTAVKTSRSGYLQRCLVKLLEGVVTQYDMTVRDSDGGVIQFLYGEDGMDVCKSQYLKAKQMDFLQKNSGNAIKTENSSVKEFSKVGGTVVSSEIENLKAKIKHWQDGRSRDNANKRSSDFLNFAKKRGKDFRKIVGYNEKTGRLLKAEAMEAKWRTFDDDDKEVYRKRSKRCPEPVLGKYLPSNFGAISENLEKTIESYSGDDTFRNIVYSKAMEALSNPGDAVGVLAAQSIGEPSTQMTLNTFHFAGRGEMNVTLGIPRLREILMVASDRIKTPCMDIPFHVNVTSEKAEALRIELTRVCMDQIMEDVIVVEKLDHVGNRYYELKFVFLPFSEYQDTFYVRPSSILKYFERGFLRNKFLPAVRRAMKMKSASTSLDTEQDHRPGDRRGRSNDDDYEAGEDMNSSNAQNEDQVFDKFSEAEKRGQGEEHESSDEEEEPEDADATQTRRQARQVEREYEDPEDEERIEEEDDAEDENTPDVPDNSSDIVEVDEGPSDLHFSVNRASADLRRQNVLALDNLIYAYNFDRKKQSWCELTLKIPPGQDKINMGLLLKDVASKAVIHQVQDINRAFISQNNGILSLRTEGINILAMANYQDLLDLTKLHCNNIHIMARHFGIEAALKVLIKELSDVFKAYGIVIDPRHLSLIADYMTNSGVYRPFNRIGIGSSTSPLHQMSFETVVNFLRDATLGGKRDDLQNPSSRLIIGKSVNVGTQLFECHTTPTGLPAVDVGRKFRNSVANPVIKFKGKDNEETIYGTSFGMKKNKKKGENSTSQGYDPFSFFSNETAAK